MNKINFLGSQLTIKPWGFEYIVCQTKDTALWCLRINKNKSTSFHCHPMKRTGFVVILGEVQIEFMSSIKILRKGDYINFRPGLFHKTMSLADYSILLEIESPDMKEDLLRLEDSSGRKTSKIEKPVAINLINKNRSLLAKEFKALFDNNFVNLNNFNITLLSINNLNLLSSYKKEDSFIMFLNGSILTNKNYLINEAQRLIGPADVISVKNLIRMKNIINRSNINLELLLFESIK